MPQAISYVRFSSLRQSTGTSVDRQEQMIGHWLDRHPEYDLSPLQYKDLAKSGYKGQHIEEGGGFGQLLEAIQRGAIKPGDVVLVEAIDRAGRLAPMKMLKLIISPILEAGVSIITLDDNTEYTEASLEGPQIFLLIAKIQSAHQYSATLSRRVKAAYDKVRVKAAEGVTPKRYTPVWLTSEGELIDNIAEQVRLAYDLYISGLGKSTIAKRMRESGVPELAKVAGASIGRWLTNRAAIGEWEGYRVYPPVVSLSTFQKAQLHKEKVATKPVKKTAKNFLVGLMKCGVCGKNYVIQHRVGKTSSVRCRNNQMVSDCTNNAHLPLPIIQALMAFCANEWKRKAVSSLNTGVNEAEIAQLRSEVEVYTTKLKGLTDSVMALGALPELVAAMKENNEGRDSVAARITLLERTVSFSSHWATETDVWRLERDDPQKLSSLLVQVGFSITIYPDKTMAIASGPAIWKYKGKDKASNRFILDNGHKLYMIARSDYCDTGVERYSDDENLEILEG